MYGRNEIPNNINNGFSPWEQWTPESTVCFHDRIAEGIKDKVLSSDKIAAVVLRLLNRANEISLALLKEVRYADTPQMCDLNIGSLITVQQGISRTIDLLKGRNVDDLPRVFTAGKIMLHRYSEITNECYVMVSTLNIFDYDTDLLLHHARSAFVAKILVLLTNVLDAIQQCNLAEHPLEHMPHSRKDLAGSLSRIDQALRIIVNSLNAAIVSGRETRRVSIEKSILLTNASILLSTLKLFDIASHRAFSRHTTCDINALRAIRTVQHCCVLRILSLRTRVKKYIKSSKNITKIHQALRGAVWALDHLYDEVYTISGGTYSEMGKKMHYSTMMAYDITECVTVLTLLCTAYEREGERNLDVEKALNQEKDMAYSALLCCLHLKKRDTRNASILGADKLREALTYLESVCSRLRDISQLPHRQWSRYMLIQAIKCADHALDTCISKLKSVEMRVEKMHADCKNLQKMPCNMPHFPKAALSQKERPANYIRGGGYSDDSQTHSSALSPSSSLEDMIDHDMQSLAEVRQNSNDRSPTP
ncbi:hypothetical protein [Candidatus Anaplasma sp. TIGMIC]|uniref:hypothetical protein n=1 Tax=Candidatus Anaplasma sp. TIGMIC TaxID=3020713 RepID=UPI00232B97B5|nr:hypothetical protein [Candidatus Anaplasma sp. TIGMIC]